MLTALTREAESRFKASYVPQYLVSDKKTKHIFCKAVYLHCRHHGVTGPLAPSCAGIWKLQLASHSEIRWGG